MSNIDFYAPIAGALSVGQAKTASAVEFVSVTPVPANAPAPPRRHPRVEFGVPSRMETYYGPDGALLGFQCRFDREDGSKAFQPLTLFRETATGALKWKWKGWADPRPLYGLAGCCKSRWPLGFADDSLCRWRRWGVSDARA